MKILLALFMALMFTACSTEKKQSDTTPPQAASQTPAVHEAPKVNTGILKSEVCESGDDKRSLEIHKKDPGCELNYTKFGQSKVVSSGKYGIKHCEDSFDKITKKLEAQNFKCEGS